MDFLHDKVQLLKKLFFIRDEKPKDEVREVTRFEGYLVFLYKVLSWDDVLLTLAVFLGFNFIFWLVIYLKLKFFGIIFLSALVAFVMDFYFEGKPRPVVKQEGINGIEQIKEYSSDIVLHLISLRKENPTYFAMVMSGVFLSISFISRCISGPLLCYVTLLGLFFIPLGIMKAPQQYVESIKHFFKQIRSEKDILAEDELIPLLFHHDLDMRDPDLDSLLSDNTAGSTTNSLISSLSLMPSHLDAEDQESLKEEDLEPQIGPNSFSRTPGELSSDSDSDSKNISFHSDHFRGDSSEDELKYAPEIQQNDQSFGIIRNIMNVIISNPSRTTYSSSESDFEMINVDDVSDL